MSQLPRNLPASRSLSRRGKINERRDLCRLPTSFLSRMPTRFLNNQWRFCHVWHNPENRFGPIRVEDEMNLRAAVVVRPHYKSLRKAEEANFKANFSFFTSLSTGEAHVFGVKFIGPYGTVGFIEIREFSFWGESDLCSDVWPAMDGVVSMLTEVSHDEAKMKDLP